jgi:basic amino acid/polyamine antiporter, APA family
MTGHLRRILGVGFGLAAIIGSTLGIGILRTPGLVAAKLPSPTALLVVWLAGGLYTLLGAACLVELGAMLPLAGGYYVYARRAFGERVGFAVGWSDWITYCAVLGYVSIGMAEFLAILLPSLAGAVTPVALAALAAFVALQWAGLRVSQRFQETTTALKFVSFTLIVIAGLWLARGRAVAAGAAAPITLAGVVIALQSVVIAYGGWQSALYFAEEDREPAKNLPRSTIGGVASIIVIYLLVNVALLAIIPMPALMRSTLPAADAAERLIGARGGQIITALSLLSLPPLLNAIMMIGTRILFAMGRDGLVWRRTAAVTSRGTPGVATLVTTAVAMALIATGTFQRLIGLASIFLALNYCVCCVALVVLRVREPDLPRPFRAWGYPWSAVVVLLGAAGFLAGVVVADTRNGAAAAGLLAIGIVGRGLIRVGGSEPSRAAQRS